MSPTIIQIVRSFLQNRHLIVEGHGKVLSLLLVLLPQ
jgi:hypothetical protein